MVRAALGRGSGQLSRGPVAGWRQLPALTVMVASSLALLPVVSTHGWWPDFGLLVLLAWRMLRGDPWAAWIAAPLGLWNDFVTGSPIGLSVSLWTAFMLAMDVIDRRTMWRDYWVEWGIATLLIALAELAQWRVAALGGAPVRMDTAWPAILVTALCYPIAGFIVSRIDRWRLAQ